MITDAEILKQYEQTPTVAETARAVHLSEQTVRRVLITHGIYPSETSKTVHRLLMSGYTPQEVADKMEISMETLQTHMPYTKGSYAVGTKSINAKRIAACRTREKDKE